MAKNISFTLKYWKQNGPHDKGHFDIREMKDIPDDTSFLEMLDILNEELINEGKEPFVFDHDCREGICGMCSLYINGHPHGPATGATTCQLYMRRFNDGDVITVEPWRSAAFPVIKDCMVDRGAFDKIMQAGGYTATTTDTGGGIHGLVGILLGNENGIGILGLSGANGGVATFFNGSNFIVEKASLTDLGAPVISRWANASAGLDALLDPWNLYLGWCSYRHRICFWR